ncbi:hypothetical protein DBV15_04945 [Temnothorax longispinosus]|uniref:Uncharacterized protein n=1 Tax=Temnothorax longispinosus TaxID=300112 RepID=A0A4S2KPP7_9HYME|nr:hypothetical protein DBV15_04945 [Temnothorax longispinosus]
MHPCSQGMLLRLSLRGRLIVADDRRRSRRPLARFNFNASLRERASTVRRISEFHREERRSPSTLVSPTTLSIDALCDALVIDFT